MMCTDAPSIYVKARELVDEGFIVAIIAIDHEDGTGKRLYAVAQDPTPSDIVYCAAHNKDIGPRAATAIGMIIRAREVAAAQGMRPT